METTGLVVGNVALTSLLIACLDGCNYVSLGPAHEREFDMAFTKLILLKGWLGAVGATVRAASQGGEHHLAALRAQWDAQKAVVRSSLQSVQGLLHDSEKLRDRYGVEMAGAAAATLAAPPAAHHDGDEMQAVEPTTLVEGRHILKPRGKGKGKGRATASSLASATAATTAAAAAAATQASTSTASQYDQRSFNAQIAELSDFVTHLEELLQHLGSATGATQVEIIQQAIQSVPEPASMRLLLEASGGAAGPRASGFPGIGGIGGIAGAAPTSPAGASTAGRAKLVATRQYIRNIVSEQAHAILGDIGHVDVNVVVADYRDNEISGTTMVVMGNVDGSFAMSFFGKKGPASETE